MADGKRPRSMRTQAHTTEHQSHSEISYAVFCMKKKKVGGKGDAIQFLHLLELCAAGRYIRAITADFQGKSIDCNKLLRSLKFV